jgi:16S rRNA (guanine527-N7)-methyltransferase
MTPPSTPPPSPSEARAATLAAARRFGRSLGEEQLSDLSRFWTLLLLWNVRINLTGASSEGELVSEHLPDAFALARLVDEGSLLLDVGSGGGLPAVPLAVLRPDLSLVLLEPRAKRCAFLRTAARELGLGARVEVRQGRVEGVAEGGFGAVAARAVWPPAEWVGLSHRFAMAGSRVVVFLSDQTAWEPPAWARVVDEVRYSAGPNERLAVALTCST